MWGDVTSRVVSPFLFAIAIILAYSWRLNIKANRLRACLPVDGDAEPKRSPWQVVGRLDQVQSVRLRRSLQKSGFLPDSLDEK